MITMIVTKIGGSIATQADPVLDELEATGPTVLVHGFGPQTTQRAGERGIEPRWIRSPDGVRSRFTDEPMLDVMQEAATEVAHDLASELAERGIAHRRLDGREGLLQAEAKPALRHQREDGRVMLVRGNRSGRVRQVDPAPVQRALDEGALPLVTPLARDEEGPVSVDADRAAAAIAAALDAEELVLLTDVDRVLDGRGDPIHELDPDGIDELLETGVAEGGMLRKLVAAREALEGGLQRVWIANGRRADPVSRARGGHATEVTRA